MSAKDKSESKKTPAIRDLSKDEIDNVSGGAVSRPTTSWVDPEPVPVQSPKSPGWIDPDFDPRR
jgi:hypothetical protein